jgi:hypothetical protein
VTTARLAVLLVLAGCGRLGFQEKPGPDDGSDGSVDTVTVIVTSDEYLAEPAGKPIAGATVLVERAAGTDRLATDATGTARFHASGALACHVIYKSDLGWRGYTIQPPLMDRSSTIELGSRPASNPSHNVTFTLPADPTASEFTVRLPAHCGFPPSSGSSSVSAAYEAACEGIPVHTYAFALPSATSGQPDLYIDAGIHPLINNSTLNVSGGYSTLPTRMLELVNLPAATDSVSAEIVQRSGVDITSLTPTPGSSVGAGTSASLRMGTVPGGNAISIRAFSITPVQYLSSSEQLAPLGAATATTFDARDMLPLFEQLAVGDPTTVAWTGGEGGTITIVERQDGATQWDWYLPASAMAAKLPDIPADLGVPGPKPTAYAQITRLAVPGATGGDLLQTIDRRWSLWPHDPLLLPQAGSSVARMLYSASLGPP